jgi:hypothetical protein
MADNKLYQLLQVLNHGTARKAFEWRATPEPRTYRLLLDAGIVRLSGSNFHRPPAQPKADTISVTVLGEDGEIITQVAQARQENGLLAQLYDMVDDTVQEQSLDKIIEEAKKRAAGEPVS